MGRSPAPADHSRFLLIRAREQAVLVLHRIIVVAALMLVVAQIAASGQEKLSLRINPVPTSYGGYVVSGMVLDPSDAPIVGAKIALHSKSSENQQSTLTDAAGKFQFDNVVPDSYEIGVQQEGFKEFRTRVKVESRALAGVRIVLQLAELQQEITVPGAEALGRVTSDVADNADAMRLDRQTLNSLPIMGNDVVGTIARMAGSGTGPGGLSLIVDGVPSSELGVPISEIAEVKINQNPYSAEFSAPGQNRMEIVTKTGSQHYHGALDMEFRDHLFDARNAFAVQAPQDRHLNLDWYLSGPLGRSGKTTFSVSGERIDDENVSIVDALTPSGPVRQNFPMPERSLYLSGKITHQIGQNTLSLRYSFFNWTGDGENVGGFTLPEAATNAATRKHYLFGSDRTVLSPNLINEISARLVTSQSSRQSVLPGTPAIEVLGAFTGGGGQQDRYQTQNSLQLSEMLSWSHGNQLVKAGVNIPSFNRIGQDDRSNFGGTFQFSTLQDYLLGTPLSFVQQSGNGRLVYWQKELSGFAQDEIRVRPNLSVAIGLRYDWQNYISDMKNFAPRISFAYAPGKTRGLVFRGGAGIFYQTTGAAAIGDMLRFNGHTLQQIVLSDPLYPNPFAAGGLTQTLPISMVQFAPDLRLPYIAQYSFGIETQLSKSTSFTAAYIGSRGFDLFLSRDINAPLPPLYVLPPNPAVGVLRQIESAGSLKSNSLKLSMSTKLAGFFTGRAQYTFGQTYDNTGGINWFPANQYDLTGEWSRSDTDARHEASFYGTFNIWKLFDLGAILSARSGLPYTITTGTDVFGTTLVNARPEGVARNSLQGPGLIALDLRWAREFTVHRSGKGNDRSSEATIKIAVDAFNVLNRVNFGQPVGDLISPFFGMSTSASSARHLQISLGFEF